MALDRSAAPSGDLSTVRDFLERASDAISQAVSAPAAQGTRALRDYIVNRTRAGKDKRGGHFKSYAKSTREAKRRKGQRITPVSLTDTRTMLDSLTTKVPASRARYPLAAQRRRVLGEVVFGNREAERIARFHIGGTRKMPVRDFWGIGSDAQARLIAQDYGRAVLAEVPKDRRRRAVVSLQLL